MLADAYRDDGSSAWVLAHELVHVAQQRPGMQPLLRRVPSCTQLLGSGAASPARQAAEVGERAVQQFVADELRRVGGRVTVERELPIPAGSAAPFRTEGRPGDDTVINPRSSSSETSGGRISRCSSSSPSWRCRGEEGRLALAVFAETQLQKYLEKGNNTIDDVELAWPARRHPGDRIASVLAMPSGRYIRPNAAQRSAASASPSPVAATASSSPRPST